VVSIEEKSTVIEEKELIIRVGDKKVAVSLSKSDGKTEIYIEGKGIRITANNIDEMRTMQRITSQVFDLATKMNYGRKI